MKTTLTLFLFLVLTVCSEAQSYSVLKRSLTALSSQIKEVGVGDDRYAQFMTATDNSLTITINQAKTDKKNITSSEAYTFNLSDINQAEINYKIQKDAILIRLAGKASKKYIRHSQGGKKPEFVSSFNLYSLNIDDARTTVDLLKKIVAEAETINDQVKLPGDYFQIIKWLKNTIGPEDTGDDKYERTFDVDQTLLRASLFQSKTDKKGIKTENSYAFNLADLGAFSTEIKSDKAVLEISTKNKVKYIRNLENGKSENVSSFEIQGIDLDKIRQIESVFRKLLPMAEKQMEKSKPTINTLAGAFAIVSKSMQTVKDEKVTIEQSIKVGCTSVFTVKYSGGKDNTEDVYSFNFGDINEQKIVLSDKSDHLKIKVPASDKFISYQQNGVRQNYTGDIEIISDNIETLRFTTAALRFAVQGCRQSIKPELYSGNFTQLIALINKQSPNFKNGREELKQGFEVIDQSLCKVKFNQLFTNEKSSSDILYEFGFKDCNPESVQLSVSGKNVFVSFQTNNKEKIIKTYENGKAANYTNTVKIQVDDIERAKGLVNMMKHTMKFCRK